MRNKWIAIQFSLTILIVRAALGQAIFNLTNIIGPYDNAPVFDATGLPLTGTNYLVELWGGTTPDLLIPAISLEGGILHIARFYMPGYFQGGEVELLNVESFSWAWLQVRVWDVHLGLTYEATVLRGVGGYGESPLFYAQGGGMSPNGDILAPLIGLQSFSLQPATAVLIKSIRREADKVVVEWYFGFRRYQLQQTVALGQAWVDVGEPTTATSATNTISGNAAFFRVLGLVE
ncbi:MAG: hypothetical protein M1608_16770 [Candidatus Omnitrophica bacterium]|nr:hypothetical protein [Candidatus Omnitrophota bacterium]